VTTARWYRPPAPGRAIFVAIPLSDEAKHAVAAAVERVQARAPGTRAGVADDDRPVRWVRMDGLHVTVRFLGPTLPERMGGVEAAVSEAATDVRPFGVRLSGAGAFPNPRQPRTLWVSIVEGVAELEGVARRLDAALVSRGWDPDPRPFRAHLTLARSDGLRAGPETLRLLVAEMAALEVAFQAERLILFESLTGGGPARYEPLLEVPFPGVEASRVG